MDAAVDASARDFARRLARCFQAPPKVSVDKWADQYREMSKVANAKGGRWRTRCFQRETMSEMTNPEVRSVVVIGAAQTFGKSEIVLNFIGRQVHLNPGPILLVNPSTEFTERFSKKRLQPMLTDTKVLRDLCGEQKSRASGNTLRSKDFPGGNIFLGSANVASDLASDPMRDVLIDEVDRCDKACGNEGDIVTLAEARQESFGEEAFSLFTSTPSGTKPRPIGDDQPAGVSKIMVLFLESDQRYWFCPCQKCGRSQTLKWAQVQWPEHKPEEARYVCEFGDCLHPHTDAERVAMVEQGEWKATAPFHGRRGYFLNGIYSLSKAQRGCVSKLHQMARDFLRAKRRGKEALRAWVNTFLCECFADTASEAISPMPLYERREIFGAKLPEKVCILTAGVDVHPDRLEVQIIGWGEGEEAWPLWYDVLLGDPEKQFVWNDLTRVLRTKYPHPLGIELPVERTAVDTGFATDRVYRFCVNSGIVGLMPVKGIKGYGLRVMNLPSTRKKSVQKMRPWLVSKNSALKTILAMLKIAEPQPGYVHFRSDLEPRFGLDYFKQLSANEVTTKIKSGVEIQDFDAGERRDEAMDTFIYGLAALRARPVDYARLMERMKQQAEAEKAQRSQERQVQKTAERPRRGGWMAGFKS